MKVVSHKFSSSNIFIIQIMTLKMWVGVQDGAPTSLVWWTTWWKAVLQQNFWWEVRGRGGHGHQLHVDQPWGAPTSAMPFGQGPWHGEFSQLAQTDGVVLLLHQDQIGEGGVTSWGGEGVWRGKDPWPGHNCQGGELWFVSPGCLHSNTTTEAEEKGWLW